MNKTILKGMQFYGFHGVLDFEQKDGQPFIVDLEFDADYEMAAIEDNLMKTVNYAEVFATVEQVVENERFQLIEALAYRVLQALFQQFELIDAIDITIKKPNAPIDGNFAYVAVRVKKHRFEMEE